MHQRASMTVKPQLEGMLWRYVFSTDHKIIGLQYFFLSFVAVLIGMVLSLLMRIHLVWPRFGGIKPEDYLAYLTMHGTLMVFFVLSTVPLNGFGNYFLPLQLGASEMAFPRLNLLGFWITLLSFLVLISAFFVPGGASLAGWTQYPPLSAVPASGPGQGLGTDLWIVSIGLFCLASVIGSHQLHYHHTEAAHLGYDPDAYAAHLLDVVCYRYSGLAGIHYSARGGHHAVARPQRGH